MKVVFPDVQHDPTTALQFSCHATITVDILGNLGPPEFYVRFWLSEMLWARVPKTSVYKYRYLMPRER